MKQQVITERIKLYLFDDMKALFGVNFIVAVIEEEDVLYVIDTYLGNGPMRAVMQQYTPKPVVVINTHSDWDHIWGNAFFEDAPIYASQAYPACFARKADREFKKYRRFHREVDKPLSADRWVSHELTLGNLLLFNTPGHTMDSLSVYDKKDKALFVADNLFARYRDETVPKTAHLVSLKKYLTFDFDYLIPSHVGLMDKADILKAISLLEEI